MSIMAARHKHFPFIDKFFFGLTRYQRERYLRIMNNYNFYNGFHWEGIPRDEADVRITENFCRTFVDKYVAFEMGKSFYSRFSPYMEDVPVMRHGTESKDKDGKTRDTLEDYMARVWYNNNIELFAVSMAKSKSITGEAWVYVQFQSPEELDDPFNEHPYGKIKVSVMPTEFCFPTFDPDDREKIIRMEVRYFLEQEYTFGDRNTDQILVSSFPVEGDGAYKLRKFIWEDGRVLIIENDEILSDEENPYGLIPFVQIKNYPNAGSIEGQDDLSEIIPLNIAKNKAVSDFAKILEYHASPVTLIYGARQENMAVGPNKTWGNLPEKARVENLEMRGDLGAMVQYIEGIDKAMQAISSVTASSMGERQGISNTSGVALSYANLPLIEKNNIKRLSSRNGLERVNKLIIYLSQIEGLIIKPDDVSQLDFMYNVVEMPDTLPKDEILELQRISEEMKNGLLSREDALKRLGVEDVGAALESIDIDFEKYPVFYNSSYAITLLQQAMVAEKETNSTPSKTLLGTQGDESGSPINSGITNGQTAKEQVRVTTTGRNA